MSKGNGGTLLELYRAALPPVRKKPLRDLPKSLYRYIWQVSAPQQVRLCLLTCLVFPLSMVPLELQRQIIDRAIAYGDTQLLFVLCGIYLGVILLHGALKYLRNLYLGRVGEGVTRVLRRRMLADEKKDGGDEVDEGARVSMVVSESERLGEFVGESLSFPLLQIGIVVSVLGYMFFVEPLIAAITLALFIPTLIVTPILQRAINRLAEKRTVRLRELGDSLVEEGNGGDQASREETEYLIEDLYRLRLGIVRLKYLLKFVNNLVAHLGPLSVLLVGGWFVIHGETQVGTIVAFISGYERITSPLRELVNYYRRLSQMRVQYRLVVEAVG